MSNLRQNAESKREVAFVVSHQKTNGLTQAPSLAADASALHYSEKDSHISSKNDKPNEPTVAAKPKEPTFKETTKPQEPTETAKPK